MAVASAGARPWAASYIVVDKHGTSHGGDAYCFVFQSHFFDNFGYEFMNYAVTASRAVVHGIIVHQSRFLGNQILGLYNIFFCHNHFSYLLVNRMKNSINLTNIAAPQT